MQERQGVGREAGREWGQGLAGNRLKAGRDGGGRRASRERTRGIRREWRARSWQKVEGGISREWGE
eukprot:5569094-Karenia_brevis.AAC.1